MISFDRSLISKQIDRLGEDVTVESFLNQTYSEYGDLITQTTSESNVKAIFNSFGVINYRYSDGQFEDTKFSFFFKGTQQRLDNKCIIERSNGERWKATKVINHFLNGTSMVKEVLVTVI